MKYTAAFSIVGGTGNHLRCVCLLALVFGGHVFCWWPSFWAPRETALKKRAHPWLLQTSPFWCIGEGPFAGLMIFHGDYVGNPDCAKKQLEHVEQLQQKPTVASSWETKLAEVHRDKKDKWMLCPMGEWNISNR